MARPKNLVSLPDKLPPLLPLHLRAFVSRCYIHPDFQCKPHAQKGESSCNIQSARIEIIWSSSYMTNGTPVVLSRNAATVVLSGQGPTMKFPCCRCQKFLTSTAEVLCLPQGKVQISRTFYMPRRCPLDGNRPSPVLQ